MIEQDIKYTSILIRKEYKDRKYWLILKKTEIDPTIGFLKTKNGNIKRIKIKADKKRRMKLMIKDGVEFDELLSIEGPLNEEEMDYITNLYDKRS